MLSYCSTGEGKEVFAWVVGQVPKDGLVCWLMATTFNIDLVLAVKGGRLSFFFLLSSFLTESFFGIMGETPSFDGSFESCNCFKRGF